MSEYESIRNEIISMEEQQRNVWIHMYVLFITLFVLGIELSYHLFLVTYVVLIPFQVVINRYKWSISKMSTYIRLFYEKDEKNTIRTVLLTTRRAFDRRICVLWQGR